MSRLLSKIMLALLMLPLAALIYTVVTASILSRRGYQNDVGAFLAANIIVAVFVAAYWIALWRGAVKWTRRRFIATGIACGVAIIPAAVGGYMASSVDRSFGIFIGGVTAILMWLVCTIFIWRETSAERLARIRAGGSQTIACPTCGYNLTGLKQTTCPECGSAYTLDELLAAQPSRTAAEIEHG